MKDVELFRHVFKIKFLADHGISPDSIRTVLAESFILDEIVDDEGDFLYEIKRKR